MPDACEHGFVFAIVEDEPDMQVLIAMMLRRDGRLGLIGHASSATSALALLDRPDVRAKFERDAGASCSTTVLKGRPWGSRLRHS